MRVQRHGKFWSDDYWDTTRVVMSKFENRRYIETNPVKSMLFANHGNGRGAAPVSGISMVA